MFSYDGRSSTNLHFTSGIWKGITRVNMFWILDIPCHCFTKKIGKSEHAKNNLVQDQIQPK